VHEADYYNYRGELMMSVCALRHDFRDRGITDGDSLRRQLERWDADAAESHERQHAESLPEAAA
jgi:hypothetical protein